MNQLASRRRIHTLSFAIAIKDGYSSDRIREGVTILLNGLDYHPVINSGFYYTFLNLPDGTYTIRVMDEAKKYFDEELKIKVPDDKDLYKLDKLYEISLLPRPYYYKFPPGETLLCGTLREKKDGPPISGAKLEVKASSGNFPSRTDELGRFIVDFGVLHHKDIDNWGKKEYVKGTDLIDPRAIDILITYSINNSSTIVVRDIEVGVSNGRDLQIPNSAVGEEIPKIIRKY